MDPATATLVAAGIAAASQAASSGMGSASAKKDAKKSAKEKKRQTLADMYNKALQRELDSYKFKSEQSGNNTARRAAALQETSNGFSKALLGR